MFVVALTHSLVRAQTGVLSDCIQDVLVPALAWSLNGEWGINSICHIDSFAKIFGIKCEGLFTASLSAAVIHCLSAATRVIHCLLAAAHSLAACVHYTSQHLYTTRRLTALFPSHCCYNLSLPLSDLSLFQPLCCLSLHAAC